MFGKYLVIASMLLFIGCGTSSKNSARTYETLPQDQGGNSLVINGNGNQIEYTVLEGGSVLVECEGGECGGVYAADEIFIDDNSQAASASSCTDGVQGECPDGYFFCPIENKCIPR